MDQFVYVTSTPWNHGSLELWHVDLLQSITFVS